MAKPTIVIGAGLGGLAAALRLRQAGRRVIVVERNERAGGKCGRFERDGFVFDTGPSVLTMPFVLQKLFSDLGRKLEDYLEIRPVEPGCRYFFADGSRFDAPGNLLDFRRALADAFPRDLAGYDRFIAYARRLWTVSGPMFLFNPLDRRTLLRLRWRDVVNGLSLLRGGTLHRSVSSFFKDARLIQLFDRFATYNGSDPFRAPSAFNVISYAELAFGSWRCVGGMYALTRALVSLGEELGVEFRYGHAAKCVFFRDDGARVEGVELANGELLPADEIVVNVDAVTARTDALLAEHPRAKAYLREHAAAEPSSSGYVVLAAMDRRHPALAQHNVFFCRDYAEEFADLFGEQRPVRDPTLYVSVPSRHEPALAPEGKEGWFLLVNAPARTEREFWPEEYGDTLVERARQRVPEAGESQALWTRRITPTEFHHTLGAWRGSLYGQSSNRKLSAFRRVKNVDAQVGGLYFCGGSAHPGGGIPLVLLSGALVARAALGR